MDQRALSLLPGTVQRFQTSLYAFLLLPVNLITATLHGESRTMVRRTEAADQKRTIRTARMLSLPDCPPASLFGTYLPTASATASPITAREAVQLSVRCPCCQEQRSDTG